MFSAFLSRAASTAPVTAFGSRGARVLRRGVEARAVLVAVVRVVPLDALPIACVLAMQLVYRSIQMMRANVTRHCRRHQIVQRLARGDACSNRRGGDVA